MRMSNPMSTPKPGPRPIPVVGWRALGLSLMRDPISHLTMMYRRYGLISAWDPRDPRYVFAFGPQWNKRIFGAPDLFHSDPFREVPVPPDSSMARLRSGLLGRNGEPHHHHRQLMQTAFHSKRVEGYWQAIVASTDRELEAWRPGEQRDLARDMHRLTLDIGMRTMFGLEEPAAIETLRGLVARLLADAGSLMTMLLPFDLPGTSYRRSMRTAARIEQFLRDIIDEKRQSSERDQDILAVLVAACAHGTGMTDEELVGEAYTIFCHETSANALTWTLFLLEQHPAELANLLDELEGELHGDPPAPHQLTRLPQLDRILKESLRLLSPAFFGSRNATAPCELGPFELAEGATVFFSQYISHRLQEIYPEPQRFRPRRWEGFAPSPYEYLPFGVGVHGCIAAGFAMMEMKVVLAMVLQRYRLTLVPKARVDRAVRISLVPRNGLPMIVSPQDRQLTRTEVSGNIREMVDLS
jgi:cytochrome P450